MIALRESDRSAILQYLDAEPEMNLFFYGDICNFGVDRDPVHVFALPGKDGGWDALLLQFFENYVLYSCRCDYDAAAVAEFLRGRAVRGFSGKLEVLAPLAGFFPEKTLRPCYMSRCNHVSAIDGTLPEGASLSRLGADDADELLELLSTIQEFADTYGGGPQQLAEERRAMLTNLENGSLWYGVRENGRLVSAAQTTADNDRSAMIVSVATRPGFRGRGYASATVAALCRGAFAGGKQFLCLFYDNPDAGRIYRRLGFAELGQYAVLS